VLIAVKDAKFHPPLVHAGNMDIVNDAVSGQEISQVMTVAIGFALIPWRPYFYRQFLFQQVFNERLDETLYTRGNFASDDLLQISKGRL